MKMTDIRKAAEQALEALEEAQYCVRTNYHPGHYWENEIEALRQALAQPEQEPVGYVTIETISSWAKVPSIKWFKKPTQGPLYTAPPKREWVGLTDEDVKALPEWFPSHATSAVLPLVRAVQDKLKEKNA